MATGSFGGNGKFSTGRQSSLLVSCGAHPHTRAASIDGGEVDKYFRQAVSAKSEFGTNPACRVSRRGTWSEIGRFFPEVVHKSLPCREIKGSDAMKSLDSQIRQKRFRLDEFQRRVAQLEGTIAELKRRSTELEHEINLEHGRTKINDPHHFAYSPLAKSLTQCRANLERSIRAFEVQLENEKSAASEVLDNLNELLQERQRREEHASRSTESSTDRSAVHRPMAAVVIV
jgi:flagellar protein FliJ